LAGLAAVELGAELVTAALPALGDLLDGLADGLEPVQLSGPGGPPLHGAARSRRLISRPQALDVLVEVAAEAAQLEQ
jgi:hypothetical protein